MYPKLTVDLAKLQHNMAAIVEMCRPFGISSFGVTKVCLGWPEVGQALLEGGAIGLADSRLRNLRRLKEAGLSPLMLLRSPALSEVEEAVETAQISLNSEKAVLKALSDAAAARGVVHQVLLMVDLGDMREGVWDDKLLDLYAYARKLPGIEVWGLGANFACLNGSPPWRGQYQRLAELAQACGDPSLVISGGNSSTLHIIRQGLWPGEWTSHVSNLRIGESAFLGWDIIDQTPLPGCSQDVCRLLGEVIEVQDKPTPQGLRRRALVALGKQDLGTGSIRPIQEGMEVKGITSDHAVVDVTGGPHVEVGSVLAFAVDYWALLALCTSPYVIKEAFR